MNRSKTPLLLMEQVLMLLVFAITAAFCVRAFVLADVRSAENAARDRAVFEAQSAAEYYKAFAGNVRESGVYPESYVSDDTMITNYSKDWLPLPQGKDKDIAYRLSIEKKSNKDSPLGKAELRVESVDGKLLVNFPIAYQNGGVARDA